MTAETLHPLVVSQDYASDLDRAVQQVRNQVSSSGFVNGQTPALADAVLVILATDVLAGGTVRAERQRPTASLYRDLRIIRRDPERPATGSFSIGDSAPIPVTATSGQFATLAAAAGHRLVATGGPERPTSAVGLAPQRWRYRFASNDDVAPLTHVRLSGGFVQITDQRWAGTDQWLTVTFPHTQPARLVAGTQCLVQPVAGRGWIIVDWEPQPERPARPVLLEPTPLPCGRQAQPAGIADLCTACGDHAPQAMSLWGESRFGSEFDRGWLSFTETSGAVTIPYELIHADGCDWEGDLFGPPGADPHWYVRVTLSDSDHGTVATLEILGEGLYEDLYLLYRSSNPYDCLGVNQFSRISHACRAPQDWPVWNWPYCISTRPVAPACAFLQQFATSGVTLACSPFLSTFVDGQLLLAGPAQDDTPATTACSFPPAAAEDPLSSTPPLSSLRVLLQLVGDPARLEARAEVARANRPIAYYTGDSDHGLLAGDCLLSLPRDPVIEASDPDRYDGLPETLRLEYW